MATTANSLISGFPGVMNIVLHLVIKQCHRTGCHQRKLRARSRTGLLFQGICHTASLAKASKFFAQCHSQHCDKGKIVAQRQLCKRSERVSQLPTQSAVHRPDRYQIPLPSVPASRFNVSEHIDPSPLALYAAYCSRILLYPILGENSCIKCKKMYDNP